MNGYEVFIHDDRYSVPSLHLISADSVGDAQRAAEALLGASPHHLGVELCADGEQLLSIGHCAERRPTQPAPLLRSVK